MFWTILELIAATIDLGITLFFLYILIRWRRGWVVLLGKAIELAKVHHDIEVIKRKLNVQGEK